MDLTTLEVAQRNGIGPLFTHPPVWPRIDAAMRAYAAQEAKSFASWLEHQSTQPLAKLWKDYEAEALNQQPK